MKKILAVLLLLVSTPALAQTTPYTNFINTAPSGLPLQGNELMAVTGASATSNATAQAVGNIFKIDINDAPYNASGFLALAQTSSTVSIGATTIPLTSTTGFYAGQIAYLSLGGTSGNKNYACTIASVSAGTSITCSGTAVTGNLLPPTCTSGTSLTTAMAANYVVYSIGTTTLTGSAANGATSLTFANANGYAAGQGLLVYGGAASGANLITTIQSVNTGTGVVTISPAISNVSGVASGTAVQHDDTAAFQAAVNQASYTHSIRITGKDGFYQINGPASGSANASIILPSLDYYPSSFSFWNAQATIEIDGVTPAPETQSYLASKVIPQMSGMIIQTNLSNGAHLFAGYDSNSSGNNFTNVQFILRNITFRTYPNPNITPIYACTIESLQIYNSSVDTGDTGQTTQPTHSLIYAIVGPCGDNGGNHAIEGLQVQGYYNGIQASEHSILKHIRLDNDVWPLMLGSSNSYYGVQGFDVECNGDPHCIGVNGGQQLSINFPLLNIEHQGSPSWVNNIDDISDSGNLLTGFVSTDEQGGAVVVSNAVNLHVVKATDASWPIPTQVFSNLSNSHFSAAGNGTMVYCSDCTIASTCAGSGTGALAKRLNGAWVCN